MRGFVRQDGGTASGGGEMPGGARVDDSQRTCVRSEASTLPAKENGEPTRQRLGDSSGAFARIGRQHLASLSVAAPPAVRRVNAMTSSCPIIVNRRGGGATTGRRRVYARRPVRRLASRRLRGRRGRCRRV